VVSAAASPAAAVLTHARAAPARLAAGRLICIDGPAGSGKSTLADQVHRLSGAPVLRMDDLYPGWNGLFDVDPHVLGILEPLSRGESGRYCRYDWPAGEYRESRVVDPAPLLVLEGVGAGNLAWSRLVSTLVWVEAPAGVRLARGVARDGEHERAHLVVWSQDEERLFAEQDTRARADLVFET
jgi:uridine kinase